MTSRTLSSGAVGERGRKVNDGTKPVDTATGQTQAKTPTVAGSAKFGFGRREAPNFDANVVMHRNPTTMPLVTQDTTKALKTR